MFVINSAAYVHPEFQNELGLVPPCLLPIGNRKLIELQVEAIKNICSTKILVSLPESYILTVNEQYLLQGLGVDVIQVPDDFSLGESLVYILNTKRLSNDQHNLRLLHGDTLISNLCSDLDIISVAETDDDYEWEKVNIDDRDVVWSGFFTFSEPSLFLKYLALHRSNFIQAIYSYSAEKGTNYRELGRWLDLGHINTYFRSRAEITTERAFNSLRIIDNVLEKKSVLNKKIEAEALWFNTVPIEIKKYTPNLLDYGLEDESYYYKLEYLPFLPLNEIFVHGKNSVPFWNVINKLVGRYFKESRNIPLSRSMEMMVNQDAYGLYELKTLARVSEFFEKSIFNLNDTCIVRNDLTVVTYSEVIAHCIELAKKLAIHPCVMHGDLCFSNILYDSRFGKIKVIDPRGINYIGDFTIFGDQKYDLAKYTHSVIGLYDFIIADRYEIVKDELGEHIVFDIDDRIKSIQSNYMRESFIDGIEIKDIMPIVVLLFFSMLPLHDDKPKRQKAMLLNAIRLYKTYIANNDR